MASRLTRGNGRLCDWKRDSRPSDDPKICARVALRITPTTRAFSLRIILPEPTTRRAHYWPVFRDLRRRALPGNTTPRQLDSIVAQILSIGSKGDFVRLSLYLRATVSASKSATAIWWRPMCFPAGSAEQWVIGVGRSRKSPKCTWKLGTLPSDSGHLDSSKSDQLQRRPLPLLISGWSGGCRRLFRRQEGARHLEVSEFIVGHRQAKTTLNVIDFPRSIWRPERPITQRLFHA